MTDRVLENAIIRLLKQYPFYGQFLLNFRRESMACNEPLGVTIRSGLPVLTVNGEKLATFTPMEQEGLLRHVVVHVLHLHMLRRKGRNGHDWDMACDLAVNPGIEGLPAEAAYPAQYGQPDGLAAEEYYARLTSPFDMGNLAGGGIGNAAQDRGGHAGPDAREEAACHRGATIDSHASWHEADSTPFKLGEEVVRGLVNGALKAADGAVPPELRQVVAGYLNPSPIPWKQVLRQFIATAGRAGRQTTWSREHRRFEHTTPGTRKHRKLNLLVGVDVSDSTNASVLREAFARELQQIARGRETTITVVYANSRIRKIEHLSGRGVVQSYHGGGFTDLRPLFDHARALQPRPAAVIYLTDGFGEAPDTMEFPTLWVLTKEGEKPVPWGVELRLDI
ncbi:vWA domain-containing protein [Geotalea toluenoxydans]|uniref:vWA domain-containing protein n=1 Tax=Geotalea toluenoxydans TaxID=421624 RepID=UPI0006D06634|nr:VWA-like domain-containing protein [Geotalea toluenoxydans]